MEQARLFIAIALSILVFIIWDNFFVPKNPPKQIPAQEEQQIVDEKGTKHPYQDQFRQKTADTIIPPEKSIPAEFRAAMPDRPPKLITVNTPLYNIQLSEQGGAVKSFTLNDYKENSTGPESKEMVSDGLNNGILKFGLLNNSVPGIENGFFETSFSRDIVQIDDKTEINFKWISPSGVKVTKNYIFYPDKYLFNCNIKIENRSERVIEDSFKISIINTMAEKRGYGFEGPCALIDEKLQEVKIDKIEDKNIFSGNIKWVAVQDRYFMSSIIPDENENCSMHLYKEAIQIKSPKNGLQDATLLETHLVKLVDVINPGAQQKCDFNIYIGPKNVRILKETGNSLDKAVNFGWFDVIAKPCLWLMNYFYDIVPNYGLAIIVLTILIKILFWPLGTKSYKSMNEMKKLQPLMAEIREKYKNDSQKMNQEIMALYKTYKVNPLGGCLPMVAQMPIFFALYRMLYSAIELRHAPFFGWITDLSAPDRLFNFGVVIPFFEPPTGIPVLTLVMGATMFLQQKMAPPAGDPQQAKMMMMMPLFMTVIFINFSSGLVLYWLVNNVLSIAQQYYITKQNE